MLNQKIKLEMRKTLIEYLEKVEYPNYEVLGIITDGILLQHTENNGYVVLKPIVKKEEFDAEDALAEYEEKLKARQQKEQEKKKKA
jgi:hypothetical protein